MTVPARTRTAASLAVLLALSLTACGGSAANPATSPAPTATSAGSAASTPAPVTIDIVLADGKVSPNGEKINASVGQPVVLNVTSDSNDEVHAHTGGDGYELEVTAGKATTGGFTLTTPGSFEIESHHTGKIIAILNVR